MTAVQRRPSVFRIPGYGAYWTSYSVSSFGMYVTALALQVLVLLELGGTAVDVGLVGSARWLPYLVLGLVVGVLVDRVRRKPILVGADLARAGILLSIPVLHVFGLLNVVVVVVLMLLFGTVALFGDAAQQSLLPLVVPRSRLLEAHAHTDKSDAAAQTLGPTVGGGIVSLFGAAAAMVVEAGARIVSAVAISRIRVIEMPPAPESRSIRRELAEGLRWVYRHRTLAPLALGTHAWFLANSMLTTVFVSFVIVELALDAFAFGLAIAAAGVAAFVGASISIRLGLRFGVGPVVIGCHTLMALGCVVIALAPPVAADTAGEFWPALAVIATGQFAIGLAMGASNANEMGFRQAVTPDHLQGRMNTTIRSINRAMIVIGAPLGGALAVMLGNRPALWIAGAGFLLIAAYLMISPFRGARHVEVD
ncbi:MAG: MFS transporter [Cryobacterium sp.]|nr:MFS transporter [Cryobacterium sp.]